MALGTLTVRGSMNASTINATGNIGKVTLGRLIDSTIFAGVDILQNALGTLPSDPAVFLPAAARLDSLTISGIKTQPPGFQNSFVAAHNLGTIAITGLPTDGTANGGLAGHVLLKKYTRKAGLKIVTSVTGPLNTAGNLEDPVDSFFARLV